MRNTSTVTTSSVRNVTAVRAKSLVVRKNSAVSKRHQYSKNDFSKKYQHSKSDVISKTHQFRTKCQYSKNIFSRKYQYSKTKFSKKHQCRKNVTSKKHQYSKNELSKKHEYSKKYQWGPRQAAGRQAGRKKIEGRKRKEVTRKERKAGMK